MKQNGRIVRLLVSTVFAVSTMLVISCAHTEMSAEEEAAMKGQTAAESSEKPEGAAAVSGDSASAETQKVEDKAFERVSESAEKTDKADVKSEKPEQKDAASAPDAGTPEIASGASSKDSLSSLPAAAPTEPVASNEPSLVTPPAPETKASDAGPTMDSLPAATLSTAENTVSFQPELMPTGDAAKAPAKKVRHHNKKKAAAKSEPTAEVVPAPEIPTAAFTKDGHTFNRFYFVRGGDFAEKVSQILYGNSDKAKDLLAWNGGASNWKPGEVIFYVSPLRPQDTQMMSFYQEAAITPHHYMVKEGEDIFKIAQDVYGDKRSWKEIAVVNGMKNAHKVEAGSELLLLPAKLNAHATTVEAKAVPVNNQTSPAAKPATSTSPAAVATSTAASQPVAMGAAKPADAVSKTAIDPTSGALADEDDVLIPAKDGKDAKDMKNQPKAKLASMDLAQFVMHNIFLVLTGLLVSLVAVFALIKRSKDSREPVDF